MEGEINATPTAALTNIFPVANPLSDEDTGPLRYHVAELPEQTGNRYG
jgi:hypothetical protein